MISINQKFKKLEDDLIPKTRYKYEVLVIYNEKDWEFVCENVFPKMSSSVEGRSFCVTSDCLPAGGSRPEEMSSLVKTSRRVIAIISDHFISDPWCLLQFTLAMPDKLTETSAKLCGM